MDGEAAQKRWLAENEVANASSSDIDALYRWDPEEQRKIQNERPWRQDPHHFKKVRISALALLKMAMHAKSGGNIEVMGVMQGKIIDDTFIVIDAFALPVEGTETRVNAASESYEYMVDFLETQKTTGRQENLVGWYHSHPGYGCWLSGIDVGTQMTNQQYQEPFLAIVVDPHRTVAAGKVEIGAFRTYPEDYNPPNEGQGEYQTIPLDKIEDFGVHAKRYYPLDISFFKSDLDTRLLDALWNVYWVNTLSSSPLLTTKGLTTGQLGDIAQKLQAVTGGGGGGEGGKKGVGGGGRVLLTAGGGGGGGGGKEGEKLEQVFKDAARLAADQAKGLSSQMIKKGLFNTNSSTIDGGGGGGGGGKMCHPASASGGEPMETS